MGRGRGGGGGVKANLKTRIVTETQREGRENSDVEYRILDVLM